MFDRVLNTPLGRLQTFSYLKVIKKTENFSNLLNILDKKKHISWSVSLGILSKINPFVSNVHFLYPLKTSENLRIF